MAKQPGRGGSKAPRVRDVAALAGVSTATVSRAFTNPAVVSEATRKAIEDAIRETGYRMNFAARNLRRQRAGAVVALVPNLANPFFSRILAGIARVLRTDGLSFLVADTTAAPEARTQLLDYANNTHADGLILLDGAIDPLILSGKGGPLVVQACEWIDGLKAPRVVADNQGGLLSAVDHLRQLGHQRIGRLTGPEGNCLTVERARGFRNALGTWGMTSSEFWQLEGDFSIESGILAAERFKRMPTRPTAVICDNDEMALGFVNGLLRQGLSVPGDVSVVGFDDIEISAHSHPALTTIRQQRDDIGEKAARLMLDLLAGKRTASETILPVELVVRETTAAPRA